ncbi:heavy metal translocating P-type ATPase [Lutibaculum baratangense]|uniref:P-type Zn(2+) transporter n=1 Tax=Lutibaculum baratangense AMV1 TaxID=631454 RepID=V4RL74_9HYPH|nr:heavy metal translocating P-type ATPase [Lutibaculum baratangense]ESR23970.1 Lead, cadmium, zinc and mercury transporting ATPase [Lutibaculum baratangense AMV1]
MPLPNLHHLARPGLVAIPAVALVAGFAAAAMGADGWRDGIWIAGTLPVLAVLLAEIVTSLRKGDLGLDIVAALSMSAALVFGEHLAALVVALMYSGGQYLEAFAERRARREMTDLLSRVPRSAMRHRNGGLEEVPLDEIAPGDRLLVRRGDVVPVDGTVEGGRAVLDQSALTGESMPVRLMPGDPVMSGATNAGDAFDLVAERRAAESTYAGIVRLVEEAQRSRAPMARLADRYAIAFLAVTVCLAGAAWYLTGDPIRAVAVLVVATPCPLILAVPVALVAGLSRAAREGILIKGAKPLEVMARIASIVVDKTGTLTEGRPRIVSIRSRSGLVEDEILRLAASLDQASKHTIAQTIVEEARRRGLRLSVPAQTVETPGDGVEGIVDGHAVIVGGRHFVDRRLGRTASNEAAPGEPAGAVSVAVAVDGALAGEILLADELREGTAAFLAGLRRAGLQRVVLATGDRRDIAAAVTSDLDFNSVRAELTPDEKIMVVLSERKYGPVMMVGDGVNDAPALAAADVGVAMGARGAAASAEAADAVLLVDRLDRLLPGIEIAQGARRIALQSVYAGIGLSLVGMIAAALGYLTPVQGALLQEAIDVAVILNALRALGLAPRPVEPGRPPAPVASRVQSGQPTGSAKGASGSLT